MQVVVLCGGKGTRLNEYTQKIPKPLIEIGKKPILWHITQLYKSYGFKDFIFCLGYKGDLIRKYFNKEKEVKIEFVDTGIKSNKAQRIIKIKDHIKDNDFFVTYGDDLSDINIKSLYDFHRKNKKTVTLTAIRLESPFGIIEFDKFGRNIVGFKEKPKLEHYMNGGFYVFNRKIFDSISKHEDLEKEVFAKLAKKGEIAALKHNGFWKSMNTLKDVIELNELYEKGKMPWLK